MGQAGIDTAREDRRLQRTRRLSLVGADCDPVCFSILPGAHRSGTQLPTEAEFIDAIGASRVVVREATARLAAGPPVEARQSKGFFVLDTARYQAFRVTCDGVQNLGDVIELPEVRRGVETEMAVLAAEGRKDGDSLHIRQQLKIPAESAVGLVNSVEADVEFHRAVARAGKNTYDAKLSDFLRFRLAQPRSLSLRQGQGCVDAESARNAARIHMSGSLKRQRDLRDFMSAASPLGPRKLQRRDGRPEAIRREPTGRIVESICQNLYES